MIRSGLHRESVVRTVLAGVVIVDLLSFFFFVGDAYAIALANGIALNTFTALCSQTAVRGAVVLIGIAGAVAFGGRPGRLWQGGLALGALALLSTVHAQLFGSPWRHLYYSGLCLSGWLLGLAVSRRRGARSDESYARIGSIALLGAAYLNAGVSKIVYGGVDWLSGTPIQAVIIGQDGLVADSIVSLYRFWVVATPAVAQLFSAATLGFELAGPLMIASRNTRLVVAAGLFAMHANIYVLTGILYWESMVFLVIFGLSSEGPYSECARASVTAMRPDARAFAASAALLAFCAVLAIGHQSRWYARQPDTSAAAGVPSAPTSPSLQQVGPFSVGQTLAAGWSVDSLTVSNDGFAAVLSGTPGRAAFEVTCARSDHRSPFDLGAAHLFYTSDLEFRDLEAVGRAFQEQVRKATEGEDICARLASWRTAAQAGRPR